MASDGVIELVRRAGLDFDVLRVVYELKPRDENEGNVVNVYPLRIGRGREEALVSVTDMPIERDHREAPYIPGSSIKGVLRSLASQLAEGMGLGSCDPFIHDRPCVKAVYLLKKLRRGYLVGKEFKEVVREVGDLPAPIEDAARESSDYQDLVRRLEERRLPCPVCRLFGNTELASHVVVYDCHPAGGRAPSVASRTRVAIDRFRGAARSGALFQYEYVEPGGRWVLRIDLHNIDLRGGGRAQDRLAVELLKYVTSHGIQVGGMKSVGLGLMSIEKEKTLVREVRVRGLEVLSTEFSLGEVLGLG